jgi:glycerophosphoryl diester phosphodiesterase
MAAFLLAAEMGADGIELDVHLSADGELVVIHNHTVDETTDGHGLVSVLSLAELQQLDAGGWFDPRFAGERIPALQQVFEGIGPRLLINVEIKVAPGHHPLALEREVVRLIEEKGMADRVLVSSFSPRSLRRVQRLNRHILLGVLYSRPLHMSLAGILRRLGLYKDAAPTQELERRRSLRTPYTRPVPMSLPSMFGWFGLSYDALHPPYALVDARTVALAHRREKQVNVWTVNDADEMRRLRDLGVDGIITNYPDVLSRVLAES